MRRRREGRDAGVRGPGTHGDERVRAARVDHDESRHGKPGEGAVRRAGDGVGEASDAVTGEGGGRPVGEVDTADTVVVSVLRFIMEEH